VKIQHVFDEHTGTLSYVVHDGRSGAGISAIPAEQRPMKPVFAGDRIALQSVRTCQQVFSAAFIGHVESAYEGDALKNEHCTPVPQPDTDVDYLRTTLADLVNGARWARDTDLRAWLRNARLDGYSLPGAAGDASPESTEKLAAVAMAAAGKLQQLLAEVDR
jgi:hypothetical protein